MVDLPELTACPPVCGPDGRPALQVPDDWGGLPIGLFHIPGQDQHGSFTTPHPTVLVALQGSGRRWYRTAGRTHRLHTAPGMVEVYPQGLEFEHMRWAGEPGACIGIQLPQALTRRLTHWRHELDLLRAHEVFDERLRWLAGALADAARSNSPDPLYAEGLSLALLGHLNQRGSIARPAPRRSRPLSPAARRRVLALIDDGLDGDLGIAKLAESLQMSPDHFAACFKSSFGITPHRYVQQQRVARAHRLLRTSALTLAEIALAAGFASQSHFTQVFRQHTGTTPSRVREA